MEWKHPLDAFSVRDAPDRERFVESAPLAANHYAGKYLDSFFVSFYDPRVNTYAVAHRKRRQIAFLLFLPDSIDDLIHKLVPAARLRAHTLIRRHRFCNSNSCSYGQGEFEHDHEHEHEDRQKLSVKICAICG